MSDIANYWTNRSISRRVALRGAAAAGGGLAALSLVGCGSNGGKSTTPATTSSGALPGSTEGKPGGTLKFALSSFPANFGPITLANLHTTAGMVYSSLLENKWGQPNIDLHDYYNLEGDLAQTLPEQPDQTTFVFKLRPGVKFHNGRLMTSEDVRYSYDRYANLDRSAYKSRYQAWFEKAETPDPNTVVIKTKFPYADALVAMSGVRDGFIVAKEQEEGPDATNKFLGTGPFMWDSATPPVSIVLRKNPDYYMKPYPHFDEVQIFAYTDVIKRITDFTSGQIHMPWLVYAEDRDQIKKARPDAVFQTWDSWSPSLFMRTDKPPFNDKRVRQAFSRTIDRKKTREVATKGEGRDDQWFALQYKDILGLREVKELSGAKNWEFNPAEAKKLLAAAGIDKPIEATNSHYSATNVGQWFVDVAVTAAAVWRELGIANIKDNEQLTAQYSTTTAVGNYEGMGQSITSGIDSNGPALTLAIKDSWYWGPNGEHSANYNVSYVNDSRLNQLVEKQVQQLKLEDRKQTYRQVEDILSEEQYRIIYSTTTQSYFWDPKLRNARMPIEQSGRGFMKRWWFDKA